VRVAHVVRVGAAAGRVGGVVRIIHAAGTATPPPAGRRVQGGYNDTPRKRVRTERLRQVSS
jgi:hypothetical protein